jgi:transposase
MNTARSPRRCWSVYDGFPRAVHQQCVGHLIRRCRELLETAVGGAARLPQHILALIDEAFALRRNWRGHRLSGNDLAEAGLELACRSEDLVSGRFTHLPNRRLARHVLGHAMHWFWFLIDPTIDATNWRGPSRRSARRSSTARCGAEIGRGAGPERKRS